MSTASGRTRATVVALVLAIGITAVGFSPAASAASGSQAIPAAAFHDTTGITSSTVTVGNVSTLLGGLFKGAPVGAKAYAAYINSKGGMHGRKLVIDSGDDNFTGATNKQLTQADVVKDFAMVGSFSLQDNFGGAILAKNPDVPNVTVSLDAATNALPNSFSPQPAAGGWQLGPLVYFKSKYPTKVLHAGELVANQTSAIQKWNGEKAAMKHLGYKVIYDTQFAITQTDFTSNVLAMKSAGVQILFLEQMPANYASAVIKALNQQNFHPVVVLGASTYSTTLIPLSGGAPATAGDFLEQNDSLYLPGGDGAGIPAVNTFLTWVKKTSPGFTPDLYTLFGWLSAQLFTQALQKAGTHPTRGSVLQALRGIHSFDGGHITSTADPAKKIPSNCYIIAQVKNGQFVRLDDPPVAPPAYGYRCDQPYFNYSGG